MISAALDGDLHLMMDAAGLVAGDSHTNLRATTVLFETGRQVLPPSDYQVSSSYRISADQIDLPKLILQKGTTHLLAGAATITNAYSPDREATFSLSDARLELSRLFNLLRSIPGIPPLLARHVDRVSGGNLILGGISIKTKIPLRDWTFATLRDHLRADATINDAAYQFTPELQLAASAEIQRTTLLRRRLAQVNSGKLSGGSIAYEQFERRH